MKDVTQPVRHRGTMLSAVALVAALAALLALAPLASAASDPLASGTTILTVKKGFNKKLNKKKIKLLKWGSGKVKNRNVTLGVSGGSLDPTTGAGTIEQGGGFKLKYGKRTVPITELTLDRTAKAVYAKIANARMKLGFLGNLTFVRNGFGVNTNAAKLKLTGKSAKRINAKLGMKKQKPFKGGNVMSNAYSETQPKTVTVLAGNNATLVTSLETDIKLAEVLVGIETVAPATETAPLPPTYAFPIGGGTIAPSGEGGVLQTTGGLKLVQEFEPGVETTMTLNAIWVDLGAKTATVEVTLASTLSEEINKLGALGRSSIANISLTGATIKSDPSARTVSVENATATLQGVTAETLNSVFVGPFEAITKTEAEHFKEGDPLGTFSFTAQTQ